MILAYAAELAGIHRRRDPNPPLTRRPSRHPNRRAALWLHRPWEAEAEARHPTVEINLKLMRFESAVCTENDPGRLRKGRSTKSWRIL